MPDSSPEPEDGRLAPDEGSLPTRNHAVSDEERDGYPVCPRNARCDAVTPIYHLRLMFEWGGGCLWAGNDAARKAFDVGDIEDGLPLSDETRRRLEELSVWHDTSLDWDDPSGPGPWSKDEYERFNRAAAGILEAIRAELGPYFQVDHTRL